jgi:hypothetical protein
MASYQVPQFLDSGDKIFLTMNIRQFAYFMTGLGVGILFYNIFLALIPGIGIWALFFTVPALPFFYLALAQYNGRDSEVYLLKLILYVTKPRRMVFTKAIDNSDLDAKANEWTYEKVLSRWQNQKDEKDLNDSENPDFNLSSTQVRINQIRKLAKSVNEPSTNVATTIAQKTVMLEEKKKLADKIEAAQRLEKDKQRAQRLGRK